ncbi:MAG: TlpA disulfide reductase family protein [Planctomycetota bacterium]
MTRCNVGLLIFAMAIGLIQAVGCDKPSNTSGADAKASGSPVSSVPLTAQGVLEKMAATYKNASSYEDFGTLEFRTDPTQERSDTRVNFSVALQRPNKLRVEFFNGMVICDGKQWCARCELVPGQAVLREAPPKLSLDILRADDLLYSALNGGGQVPSPQFQLLLEDNPIKNLLNGSQDVTLDEPGRLGDFECYRVRVNLPEGSQYFWIDQKTFALRQFVVPIANGPQPTEEGKPSKPLWLVFNLERARLGGDIDPKAFQFDIADGVKKTRALVQAGPYELLGQKLPEFKFVDLQGKPWSSQSLAGKAAVIHFWRTDATEGEPMIPMIEQLYAKYKDNDKVAVLAVSLDPPDTPAKTLEDAEKQLKMTVPLLRDNGMEARERLKIVGPPTTLFIDAKGVLQDCNSDFSQVAAAAAPRKLERLLAGEDLAKQAIEEFQQRSKEIERGVDMQFSGEALTTTVQQVKATPAATKSEPKKFLLKSRWKCTAVHPAGNILVTQEIGGSPRIFVIDGFRSVSELGADGKLVANYKSKITKDEFFINLRSAVGRDGKRYFATFAPTEQRFHLFDEKFNPVLSYPADALENRHAGIGDVELGDLNGDGVLNAFVGFAGTVGVKCVSLQGTLIWSCRNSLFNVSRVLPGPADGQGHRELYCVSDGNSLAMLDAKGQLRDAAKIPGRGILRSFLHADLTGNGQESWCGVAFAPDSQQTSGQFTAMGISPSGEVQWKYALPAGTQQSVESVVVGRLLPGTARQWLLPGSDGSIHILAADGAPIDRFNYGEQVSGLATVEIEGKPALLISSANGVEALRVE